MRKPYIFILLAILSGWSIGCNNNPGNQGVEVDRITDDSLLTLTQYKTFQYFWEGAEPNSGLARERFHMNNVYPFHPKKIVTTGGSGFGLMAIIVGVERHFISRTQALGRFEVILNFLETSDRFHGAWPHWLDGETGKVVPFSKKDDGGDLVETAYLVQGLLSVKAYMNIENSREALIAGRIDKLWREVEWSWYQKDHEPVLYWHWSPHYGWAMNFQIRGYNECLITYVLGASSPAYPISTEAYHKGWARGGKIVNSSPEPGAEGLTLSHNFAPRGGPLFWSHYSYLGLDPRGLKDRYADYWKINIAHVLSNRQYCIDNPHHYKGYGENSWGLTASYSIPNFKRLAANPDTSVHFGNDPDVGYAAHKPYLKDYSVISPTAALSSFPYAPEECMKALKYFYYNLGDKLWGPYGFYDAFSETYDWFPKKYLAIDQGPIVVMIENYRSGLLWNLFMSDKDVKTGLKRLGFSSPWLD